MRGMDETRCPLLISVDPKDTHPARHNLRKFRHVLNDVA
jgi:hypothetical protein